MRERNEFLETIGNNVVGKGEVWALRREKGKEGKRKKKKRELNEPQRNAGAMRK